MYNSKNIALHLIKKISGDVFARAQKNKPGKYKIIIMYNITRSWKVENI